MKNMIFPVLLSLCCLAASAQPTSLGGITPGTTTREELRNLVENPDKVGTRDTAGELALKSPEGLRIYAAFQDNVVFEVGVFLDRFAPLKQALLEKYGLPSTKVGSIRAVTCRNKLGVSSRRLEGWEESRWPAKDGVQGVLVRTVFEECSEKISDVYLLRDLATFQAREKQAAEKERQAAEEKRRKLGDAF